jgi:simple sugar transport system substrate-binding protein
MSGSGFSRRDLVRRSGVTLAGASLLGLAACGREDDDRAAREGGDEGLVPRGDIRIEMPTHMIPPDPNTAIMQNGADQASRDFGVDVNFRGPEQFSIPNIQSIFDAALAARPTALAATLPDPNPLGPKIEQAVSDGIPVVLFNAGLDEFSELGAISYVGQRELDAGRQAGRRLADEGIANAIVVNHQQGQLTLELRVEGVREGLGGDVESVAVDGSSPTQIRNGVATALRQNPEVQALVTLGPGAAEQALAAIGEAGSQAKLATFDISPAVLKSVQNGEMLFAIDQQMYLQTYQSVASLVTWTQYRLAPVDAVPTGPLFVDRESAADIIELSGQGVH